MAGKRGRTTKHRKQKRNRGRTRKLRLRGGAHSSTNLFVISGNARTILKCIDSQYTHLITKLFSNDPNAKVSVYMHIKLTDPGPKGLSGYNYSYEPVDREALLKKIKELMNQYPNIHIYHTILDGEEIGEEELFSQLKERSRFTEHLAEDKFLKRSMFIHYNYERCGVNILRLQKENNCEYDTFVYTRPDIYLTEDCKTIDTYDKNKVIISLAGDVAPPPHLNGCGFIYIIPKALFKNFFVDIMNVYRIPNDTDGEGLTTAEYVAASVMPYEVVKIGNPMIMRN